MAEIDSLFAAAIVVIWPVLTGFCIWKYLRAFRENKRLDKWIWFFSWCFCISAIEWWVFSVMILFSLTK